MIRNLQCYELTVQVLSDKVNAIDSHQPHDRLCSLIKPKIQDPDKSVHLQPTREPSSIISESYKSDSVFNPIHSNSLGQLLGLLGISSNIDSDGEQVRDTLRVAVLDRVQTTRAHPSNQDLTDTALLAQLHNAAESNQLLADVLYADSPDGSFRFVDRSIEKQTLGLDSAIGDIGSCMAGMDMDVLQQKNRTKDEFVNRWAT